MSTIAINGQRVVSGSLSIPLRGEWVADVVLATPEDLPSAVTVTIGDLSLVGTVYRSASFAGSKSARVIGGAGGWRKNLPSSGYSHDAGVLASTVLADAARESGESVVLDVDRTLGTLWARDKGKAERTVHLMTGGDWWIDPLGVTQTKARDASNISTPFTVVAWSGAKGHFEIATEFYSDWQPGRTFNAPTIDAVQTISMVRFESANDGKLRLIVLSTAAEDDRMMASIRNIVRSELASLNYCAEWEYAVAPSLGIPGLSSTVDLISSDDRMPDLTNVPLAPGGVEVPPLAGTKCRVRFVNADPARAEVISLGSTTEHHITTEATALLIYNTLVALMAAAGGGPLIAAVLQPLLGTAVAAAITAQGAPAPPTTVAQIAANAALQAGFATGVAPVNTTFAAWDAGIGLLTTKTLDVSGKFPSLGVPYGS